MKLQAFQPVIASNLALCYFRLGDRSNGLEFLRKATVARRPKNRSKATATDYLFYNRRKRAVRERS